jgi:FKBP-type peptidyl-prolyl cis-trans isomerase
MRIQLPAAVLLLSLGVALSGAAIAQEHATPKTNSSAAPALDTNQAKVSYTIGSNIGKGLKREGIEIDTAIFMRGLKDGISGGKPLLTDEEAQAALDSLKQELRAKREAEMKALSEKNAKEGAAFLAANKSKPGVQTLPSGLEYKVIKQGDGPKPTLSDMVECNYRGTLVNGTEFDSSYKHGKPVTFPVSGVIKGWTEILQKMPVGSKYQVFIPADLAYGERAPAEIGPNATLIFDIELLAIKEKPEAGSHGASAH